MWESREEQEQRLAGLSDEELAERVRSAKLDEATAVIARGRDAQIEYLIGPEPLLGDGLDPRYYGHIVWLDRPDGALAFVFKTREDCLKWRTVAGLEQHPTRTVASFQPFNWRKSTGTVRDIWLSDKQHPVFRELPDHARLEGRVVLV